MRTDGVLLAILMYLVLAIGCAERTDTPESALATAEWVPVPEPSLSGVQPSIAEQIRQQQARLAQRQRHAEDPAALADAFGTMGQLYHAYDFFESAAACYVNAQQLAPADFNWPYYLGQVYSSQGDIEPAVGQLQRALELRPDYAPAAVSLARLLRDLGRPDDAVNALDTILASQPEHAVANYVMGQALGDLDDWPGSIRYIEAALQAQPEATRAHAALASAYRAAGDRLRAEQHLALRGEGRFKLADPLMEELVRLDKGVRLQVEAGTAAFVRKDYRSAVEHFEQAIAAEPDNAETRQALASALVKTGDAEGAEFQYREALRLDPRFTAAHYNLAQLHDFLGRHAEAITHYEQALRIEPGYRSTRVKLAASLLGAGRCAEGLDYLDTTIETEPQNGSAPALKAHCLTVLGRHGDALTTLETAHSRLPQDPVVAAAMARILAASPDHSLRDGHRALVIAERLIAEHKTLDRVEILAMALAQAGDPDKAAQVQQDAIRASTRSGRTELSTRLSENLGRYESGQSAAAPWPR